MYSYPRIDACAEKLSFRAHLNLASDSLKSFIEPTDEELDKLHFLLLEHLSPLRGNYVLQDADSHFNRFFKVAVSELHMSSTPGHCELSKYGSTNKEIFKVSEDGTMDEQRYQIVRAIVYKRFMEVINSPTADPIKLFIKMEPHKTEKIETNRFRLISSVSLIDGLVDRLLYMVFAHKVTANFQNTGILIGYNPTKGGHRFFNQSFSNKRPKLMLDQKAFDWTYKPWMAVVFYNLLLDLNVTPTPWWESAVQNRMHSLFESPEFIFSDGFKIQQPVRGVMKSGMYMTIIQNSIAILSLHYLSLMRSGISYNEPIFVVGDDSILYPPSNVEAYLSAMKTCGVLPKVKEEMIADFAGFQYNGINFKPEYLQKHLFSLMHLSRDPIVAGMTLRSYLIIYTYVPEMLAYLRRLIVLRDLMFTNLSDRELIKFDNQ